MRSGPRGRRCIGTSTEAAWRASSFRIVARVQRERKWDVTLSLSNASLAGLEGRVGWRGGVEAGVSAIVGSRVVKELRSVLRKVGRTKDGFYGVWMSVVELGVGGDCCRS